MNNNRACKLATRLASDALERRLSFFERLRLRLHLAMCDPCRTCKNEMKLLHEVLKQLQGKSGPDQSTLSDKDRDAIRLALQTFCKESAEQP